MHPRFTHPSSGSSWSFTCPSVPPGARLLCPVPLPLAAPASGLVWIGARRPDRRCDARTRVRVTRCASTPLARCFPRSRPRTGRQLGGRPGDGCARPGQRGSAHLGCPKRPNDHSPRRAPTHQTPGVGGAKSPARKTVQPERELAASKPPAGVPGSSS